MTDATYKPKEILLIEDSLDEINFTKEAFSECNIRHNLHIVTNGADAIKFLKKEEQYANEPVPHLILLDLNLPKKNGIEVLKEIKSSEDLRLIPVVVLTTSNEEIDIIECYRNYANCFITKPMDLTKFMEIMNSIETFWLSTVKLPGNLDYEKKN